MDIPTARRDAQSRRSIWLALLTAFALLLSTAFIAGSQVALAPSARAATLTGNNPTGYFNSLITGTNGRTSFAGYLIDPNSSAAVTLQVLVDGVVWVSTPANVPRPDVAATYPGYGTNHGFAGDFALPDGTHNVCIVGLNVPGTPGADQLISCKTIAIGHQPIGVFNSASNDNGLVQVSGWALDPDSAASVSVYITVDNVPVVEMLASRGRPDVATTYPGYGDAHGFSGSFPYADGVHNICLFARNFGLGSDKMISCKSLNVNNNPIGTIDWLQQSPTGVSVQGWAIDPNTPAPIKVQVWVDNAPVTTLTANGSRPDVAAVYPYYGANHGYSLPLTLTEGAHQVCVVLFNVGAGNADVTQCKAITIYRSPAGAINQVSRTGGTANTVDVIGYAFDAETLSPISVQIRVDGVLKQTVTANQANTTFADLYPAYGPNHGFNTQLNLDANEHQVCVTMLNVGAGSDTALPCVLITTSGQTVPGQAGSLAAWPGNTTVAMNWTAARSATTPLTGYQITVSPGGQVVNVAASATSTTITGLTNEVTYTFTIRGVNNLGTGSANTVTARPSNIPPQFTAPPVAISHYVRNLTGNVASDNAIMRAMGASDAAANPSGHRYLSLIAIGGQDEADQGVILSATSRYISYAGIVSALEAYVDGYSSGQQVYAPMLLAIDTNNDIDVSAGSGVSYAQRVVNPVQAYTAARYPGITVAGANDIEPGFSASVSASRDWLSGYLSATSAPFVFNGSADGCSQSAPSGGCNRGWTMADLQWLSGGAAPSRIISLPQIYNYAMPLQWKYISMTGVNSGLAKVNFGGVLTEITACAQAGSCFSIDAVDAWNHLWSAINSSPATSQYEMPYGTDLRIN